MGKYLLGLFGFCGLCFLTGCGGASGSQVPQPLAITSAAPPYGFVGSAYAGGGFALTATGGKGSYSWSWAPASGSALPPGLTLSNALISGSPTTANTYNVVITVTDSQSTHTSANYPITITTALAISSLAPPSGAVNVAYGPSGNGFPINVSGGFQPYSVSWAPAVGSALPPGLTLTNGKIFGTPTAQGSFNVVVTVTDSQAPAGKVSAPYTISIGSVAITSGDPPNGVNGAAYGPCNPSCSGGGFPLAASGGVPPYTFSWVGAPGSSTPPGLAISFQSLPNCPSPSPEICGVPTMLGTYDVLVSVTDSASPANQGTANYRIDIVGPPGANPAVSSARSSVLRYKLIDIGTFGGPASYFTDPGIGGVSKVLNNQGMLAGKANTTTPDPYCGLPNCFDAHVFRWDGGVLSDLGTLPGGTNSDIGGINARGWVVGGSEIADIDPFTNTPAFHATLWKGNQPVDLGTLGGYNSNALHVDDGGQIVGSSTTGVPDPLSFLGESIHPFVWQNGVMQDLGTLGGPDALPSNQCGNGRNGLVAGFSFIDSVVNPETGVPTAHDFFWHDGIMEDIPTFGGTLVGDEIDFSGYPTACVNNRGQVAGESSVTDNPLILHPYLYDHGVLTDLGTLGGSFGLVGWLNDAGDIVGGSSTANDESFRATLWTKGVIHDLGTLDGDCFSAAISINSKDQIVGLSFSCDGTIARAVLWEKGKIVDLNAAVAGTPSLQLVAVDNINDRGEIAGRGLPPGCDDLFACGHAYLLIPCDSTTTCASTGATTSSAMKSGVAVTKNLSIRSPRTPMERLAAWRSQFSQRYRIPGLPTGKLR
jgi:probable HAF family extracellular repeat protein